MAHSRGLFGARGRSGPDATTSLGYSAEEDGAAAQLTEELSLTYPALVDAEEWLRNHQGPIPIRQHLEIPVLCLHPSKSHLDGVAVGRRCQIAEAHNLDAVAAWVARRPPQKPQGDACKSIGHAQYRDTNREMVKDLPSFQNGRMQPFGSLAPEARRRGCALV